MSEKNFAVYANKQAQLFMVIGDAITRWANLESVLFVTFCTATRLPTKTAAALLVHIRTFSTMLDLVNTAVKCRIESGTEPYWNSLIEYVRELSGDRNFIAHNPVIAHGRGHPATADWALIVPKVGPNQTGFYAGITRHDPIDIEEARELVADFQQAVSLAMDFERALKSGSTSHEKFSQPIVRRRPSRKERQEAGKSAPKPPNQSSQP